MGADQADQEVGVLGLERLAHLDVGREGRRAGVQHGKLVVGGERPDVVEARPRAGASTSRLPGTSAAGWASQVGYQNERISRFAW